MDIQVEEWLNHPITIKFFSGIAKEKKDLSDILINGGVNMSTFEATGIEYIKLTSRISGLKIVEDFKTQLREE